MSFSIDEIQDQIIEEFQLFDQWIEKYEYIIELGKNLPDLDDQYMRDENLVPGCQSRVWLHAELEGGKAVYAADSDAIITKGIIALLIRVLSEQPPESVHEAELYFIDRIGLKDHLSSTRSNGLVSMINKMRSVARELAEVA
ncbi:MAG: SufE family protein [Gammaproteobacteria bacterium]|nr:SufE family protein [Gammaproteobacteria bacterium]